MLSLISPTTMAIIQHINLSRIYDTMVYHSTEHPNQDDLGSPKTKRCQQFYQRKRREQWQNVTQANGGEFP